MSKNAAYKDYVKVNNNGEDRRLLQLGKACLALQSIGQPNNTFGEARLNWLMQNLVEIIHDHLGYPNCQIFLVDPTGCELEFKGCAGFLTFDRDQVVNWRPALDNSCSIGLIGWVGVNREAVNVPNVLDDQRYFNNQAETVTRSELTVPLIANNILLGVLDIQSDQLNAFDDRDLEIISFFANQASLLVHAARPSWGRPDDLKILATAGNEVNRALGLAEIGQVALQNIAKAVNASSGEILLLTQPNGQLEPLTTFNLPDHVSNKSDRRASRLLKRVLQSRDSVFIEDLDNYEERATIVRRLKNTSICSFACLTLHFRHEILGVLFVNYNSAHNFSTSEKLLLGILAEQTASALLNARVSSREQASRRFAESLARSSRLISSQVESEAVLNTIVREVTQVLNTPMCSISLLNESRTEINRLVMIGARHKPEEARLIVGKGFIGTVAVTGQLWKEFDIAQLPEFTNHPIRVLEKWRGAIALPIRVGGSTGDIIGVLCTYDIVPRDFNADEVAYLQGLADQAAISVINAKNFEALKRERDMYQALLENANDPIFLLDPVSLQIIDANKQATDCTGYSYDELHNSPIDQLYPAHEWPKVASLRNRASGDAIIIENIEVLRKNGTHFPASFSARLVQVGQENIVIQILRDMTERWTIEQQLVRSEQLRVLGQLASGVAHDFNNLLTGILGVSELLLNGVGQQDERHLLRMVRQSALDGAQMVRRVQLLGPAQHAEMEQINLNDLLQDVVALTRPRWQGEAQQQSIRVEMRLDTNQIPPIKGNPTELREVITNLVLNAVDAMPIGGKLTLRTARHKNMVCLTVEDTGMGMSEETKNRLFEPFYTTKAKDGHGLGLSVSNSIVARHNGTIEVRSELGRGSRFIIKLPVVEPAPTQDTPPAPPPAPTALRILVVDDEPNLLYILTRFLEVDQHVVCGTSSGREAVRIFTEQPLDFDLVFTDLSIHDLNGWEVAHQIKKIRPDIPVVLVTGWGADLDPQMLRRTHINEVVNKPYRFDDLQNTVRRVSETLQLPDRSEFQPPFVV